MGVHHDHHHDHHHHAAPSSGHGRAFAVGVVLNTGFVVIEAVMGIVSGSMALVADAGHNLSDVLGLLIAWAASILAARPPSERFTYGFKSSSILAALANASLLLIALGAILVETLRRLADPAPVAGGTMIVVAAIGIAINTATALLFMRGRKEDLNIRAAFLHMAADAAVSAGVVIAGALVVWTGKAWIDPVTSLLIVAVVTFLLTRHHGGVIGFVNSAAEAAMVVRGPSSRSIQPAMNPPSPAAASANWPVSDAWMPPQRSWPMTMISGISS